MGSIYRIYGNFFCVKKLGQGAKVVLVFLLVLIGYISSSASGRNDLNKILNEAIYELKIPGAVMVVETPEGMIWNYRAGVRRFGSPMPMSRNLKFRIGSLTKTFVASLTLMLVQEGRTNLDTEVHKILPQVITKDNHVTIRHLLQMRSNLGDFTTDRKFLKLFRERPWMHWEPEKLLKFGKPGHHGPGKRFKYNNSNYVLLGMIIEKVTGDSFENQVFERILKPLKLNSTSFPVKSANIPEPYARGYDFNPQTGVIKNLSLMINPSWAWCSGNGISNASDLLNWIKAYLNGYGISEKLLVEQMTFLPVNYDRISYGLGVMNRYSAVGHNGNFAGIYSAVAYRYKGYYIVILTNGQAKGGGNTATAESVFWHVVKNSALFSNR
jgi:D-alanyl-D-alanine carboxypeptidase